MASLISIKSVPEETLKSSSSVLQLCPEGKESNLVIGITNAGFEKSTEDLGLKNSGDSDSALSLSIEKPGCDPSDDQVSGKKRKRSGFFINYAGILFTLGASAAMSSGIVFVKILQRYGFNGAESSFWRFAAATFPAIPLLIYYQTCGRMETSKNGLVTKKPSVFHTVWPITEDGKWQTVIGLTMRGILGASSVACRFFSLQYLSIGDASVISYSSPVLVTILAHFFLGEKTGIVPIVTALMALGGVAVMTRPPILTGQSSFDHATLVGTAYAVGSLICSAIMTVITRKIRAVQFSLMMAVFGIIGMIEGLILTSLTDTFSFPSETDSFLYLGGLMFFAFLGQLCAILGLKFEQAGPVSIVRTCDIVFGFIFQFAIFGVTPDIFSAVGGSIVFLGVFITATRKYLTTLPPENRARKALWILLF